MNGQRKPRRPRWPAIVNTLGIATEGASKMRRSDVDQLLGAVANAFKAMREGVGSMHHWSVLAGTLDVSLAIERQGVVRGLREHLTSAETALKAIYSRANSTGDWRPTALYFHELDSVREFVDLYSFQMKNLSRSEFEQVINTATSQIRSKGDKATVVRAVGTVAA